MQTFEDIPMFLTPEQFAELTGRNVDNVRRNVRAGNIPADRVNRKYLIYRDAVFSNAAAYDRARKAGAECKGACHA